MEDSENKMGELHEMLNKLYKEADQCVKRIDLLKEKSAFSVRQAESVVSENMRKKIEDQTKAVLHKFLASLGDINSKIEFAGDEIPKLNIPYVPVGSFTETYKFLAGDNPWNFWLTDTSIDTKMLLKNLLTKHQNDLLEPYPNPKPQESVCFLDRNKIFRGIVLQALQAHRVKVLDCDSNISKVIANDKVFKVDPDACFMHASAIKCTIQKEAGSADLWTTDLRDMFCNVLKEAVLRVKIIEQLAGSFPNFVVDVELRNEEEDGDGNLQEWILTRLLPELKKVPRDETESVCDFLTSEALNPYHKDISEMLKTVDRTSSLSNTPESNRGSLSEEDNNLNSTTPKVPIKIVPNIDLVESEKTDSKLLIDPSKSDAKIVTSNGFKKDISIKSEISEPVLEKRLNESSEIVKRGRTAIEKVNHAIPIVHRNGYVHYPQQPSLPYTVHPSMPPPQPYQLPPPPIANYPPLPNAAWNYQGPPLHQQYSYRPVANPARGNVNVMAPEFVPKVNGEAPQTASPAIQANRSSSEEVVHLKLRKPSSLLNPGDNLLVIVSYVVSPSEFYVHFATKNNKHLDKLSDEMFKHYNNKKRVRYTSWQEANKAMGDFCACKWQEDNHWYRVQVLDWTPLDNHVRVNFVDYGNIEIVPLDDIQPLIDKFTVLSMCAQPCHLAQVFPAVKNGPWSEQAIEFLKAKVDVANMKNCSVTVVIPSKQQSNSINNSLSVLLFELKMGKTSQKSVNEELVECGLAWSRHFHPRITPSDVRHQQSLDSQLRNISNTHNSEQSTPKPAIPKSNKLEEEWETWDPLSEEFNSVRNNPARNTDDPSVALVGYSATDESRICPFYARDGVCKKQFCTKEHTKPNPDGVTTDKEEVYCRAFSELALPSIGECIPVLVTAVSTINLFYVQLPEKQGLSNDNDEEEETLSLLSQFMNMPDNIMKMKYLKVPPADGQLVLANWDDTWFRARVISCDEEMFEVMFVDYGSMSSVSEKDMREMEPQYLHLPFQAIECSLANITPPKNTSSKYEKATEALRELIEGKRLQAEVYDCICSGDYNEMEILLKSEEGDIGEKIVKLGLSSERPLNWDNAFSPKSVTYYPG